MRITRPERSIFPLHPKIKRTAFVVSLIVAFLILRRVLLVGLLGLKILGQSSGLDAWKGPVRHQSVQHAGIPIDIYGESSGSPMLIVHGVNPTGKDSPDLVRISDALAQVGYQVFVPDLADMKRQHIHPEEASHIKSVFQFIGRDAAMACFSFGCGPAMVAAADLDIRSHVRFAIVFGGYYDIREALEFLVTGPESPIAYLKWVYLAANTDLAADEGDQAHLQVIAKHRLGQAPSEAGEIEQLTPEGKRLLDLFSTSDRNEFRARLDASPKSLQERLDALSPSRFIRQLQSPLILVHGINDPSIPAQQAVRFDEAARSQGLSSKLTLLRMYGHVHPILPDVGLTSVFAFYLPEASRFLIVVNQVLSAE
jgi:hypothetical protein